MTYRIAGIDVHKKKLAVVVTDVEVDIPFSRGFPAADVKLLAALVQALNQVEDVKLPIDAVHVALSIRT